MNYSPDIYKFYCPQLQVVAYGKISNNSLYWYYKDISDTSEYKVCSINSKISADWEISVYKVEKST